MIKKYHRILWPMADGMSYYVFQTDNYVTAVTITKETTTQKKYRVCCVLCEEVIFKSIKVESWQNWISTREQRHFDSDQHRQNLVLDKLAGDAQE